MVGYGGLAGFLAGLIGTGGAIRGLMLSSLGISKELFVGTSAVIDFGVDLSRTVVYGLEGFIHLHDMVYIAGLFVVAFLGSYIGKLIIDRMKREWFHRVVLIFVFFSGLAMMVKYFNPTL